MPFYSLVPPQSKFPELSGHAWVPMDDNHTLCIFFSYHPSEPLPARTRELFEEGHQRPGNRPPEPACLRQARPPPCPTADYWTKFTRENGFQFDYQSQVDTWFSGLPGLWVQDGACQSGIQPIFDRTKEHLGSSDTGIAMTRRLLLEAVSAYRDHGIKPNGVGQSRHLHGSRGLADAAGDHVMGRFRPSAYGSEAWRRFRLCAVMRMQRHAI